MTRTVIIGIGNDYRGDDGIGLAVARRLSDVSYAEVVENGGDPVALIDAWTGADLAIVVDATRSDRPPGTVSIHEGFHPELAGHGSTHSLSLADAIELGRALDRLPARLVIIGVEGADFTLGAPISPPATAALPEIVEIVNDLPVAHGGN